MYDSTYCTAWCVGTFLVGASVLGGVFNSKFEPDLWNEFERALLGVESDCGVKHERRFYSLADGWCGFVSKGSRHRRERRLALRLGGPELECQRRGPLWEFVSLLYHRKMPRFRRQNWAK